MLALSLIGALSIAALLVFGPEPGEEEASHRESETFARLLEEANREGTLPDPWLIAHLLLAIPDGGDDGGRELREVWRANLFDTWLLDRSVSPSFPLHLPDGRGEQHPDLVLKVLAEITIESPESPTPPELALLARSALARFEPPTEFRGWNDVAWLLQGLSSLAGRSEFSISKESILGAESGEPTGGERWTLERLAVETLSVVEAFDRVVEDALAAEGEFVRPSAEQGPAVAGIYATTCGGQHLLQAVVTALGTGVLPPVESARVGARVDVLIARLEAEEAFRVREEQRALAAGISKTVVARHVVDSKLKLHGHALETLSLADAALPSRRTEIRAALRREIERVEHLLDLRLTTIDPAGTIVPRWRTEDPSRWELWFGDGAHALHGLRRARGTLSRTD